MRSIVLTQAAAWPRGLGDARSSDAHQQTSTFTPRELACGTGWCVLQTKPDGREIHHGVFAAESEAWGWIIANAGKPFGE
jgi:hypothetical protein